MQIFKHFRMQEEKKENWKMSRKYQSNKSGLVIATGEIKSISDDKLNAQIEVRAWNIKEQQYVNELVPVKTQYEIEEKVGDIVTVQGWNLRGEVLADVFSKDSLYAEVPPTAGVKAKAVVAGEVIFAGKNDEIDRATGEPRLNKAGQPKKPHFDIGIAVGKGAERVTHVINIYNIPERTKEDGTVVPAQLNIERYEKLFAKFDRVENPVYAAVITQPGTNWVRESHSKQDPDRVFQNQMCSHLGADTVDVTYLMNRVKTKGNEAVKEPVQEPVQEAPTPTPTVAPTVAPAPVKAEEPAPVKEEPKVEVTAEVKEEPVVESSGFDAGDFALDDFDSDFTME